MLAASYPIEVNRPLRLRGLKIYQSSFKREDTALLRDQDGQLSAMRNGRVVPAGRAPSCSSPASRKAGRCSSAGKGTPSPRSCGAPPRSPSVPYTIVELSSRELTGLKAVKDPGFVPVLAALVLVAAGLALTFIQKSKDKES